MQIPAFITFPNKSFTRPFEANWKGLRVRYIGNIFSTNQPDMIYREKLSNGRILLPWQTSEKGGPGLGGIFEGNVLRFLDNEIYDLSVGSLFARIRNEDTGFEGFVPLEIIFGETEPHDQWNVVAADPVRFERTGSVSINGRLYNMLFVSRESKVVDELLLKFEEKSQWRINFSGGQNGGIHPVYAANQLNALLIAYVEEPKIDKRNRMIKAAREFFEGYVIPSAVKSGVGISWPYEFEWNLNWGIQLSSPWYSAYASASFSQAAALMYSLTKEDRFRKIALDAARFVGSPLSQGGAEYSDRGFRFPAEYIYLSPPLPNVRVLDGELLTVVFLMNASRLIGDSEMLQVAIRHGISLNQAIEYYDNGDGSLLFASYVEDMPEAYTWLLWANLQAISGFIKHPRMRDLAAQMTAHIPAKWCNTNGC